MKRFFLVLVLALATSPAMAIDGYKNMKFGMNKKEALKNQPCTLVSIPSYPSEVEEQYYCKDLPFAGKMTKGSAFFVRGEFLRFSILMTPTDTVASTKALIGKYGEAQSVQGDLQKAGVVPGAEWRAVFDSDTIEVMVKTAPSLEVNSFLIYTAPNYGDKLTDAAAKELANEL